jgi:uncharacterized protein
MLQRFFDWVRGTPAAAVEPEAPRGRELTTDVIDEAFTPADEFTRRQRLGARLNELVFGPQGERTVGRTLVLADGAQQSAFAQDSAEFTEGIKAQFALGQVGMPDIQAMWYAGQGFIGYQMCALIAQQWLVNKACLIPARDAVRKGFTINLPDAGDRKTEVHAALIAADKKYRLKRNLVEFINMGRVFGVRVCMFKFAGVDDAYYTAPFNPDGIKPNSYLGISQIDPYWIVPELTTGGAMDPSSIGFYEPTYWIINSKRVHKSHLVIFRGPEVADVLKPSYLYGGMSIPQLVYERVYAAERCANESPQLLLTKRSTIFYTDAAKAVANKPAFDARMEVWNYYRDNYGVKVADKDRDEVEQHDTALADLDATIMTQYQLVAAVVNMPATKLLGTSPKGFGAAGDYEIENYHEELEAIQEEALPLIQRHHLCVMRSEIGPTFNMPKGFVVDVVFNPLDSLDSVEQSTVNKTQADTDAVYVGAGVLAADEVRARLAKDPKSGYEGIPVLDDLDPADPTPEGEV